MGVGVGVDGKIGRGGREGEEVVSTVNADRYYRSPGKILLLSTVIL